MGEWRVCKGSAEADPVALARDHEVLEYELDGHAFVFACEVVPNEWAGKGVAVMMRLAELSATRSEDATTGGPADGLVDGPICARDLAAAFDEEELPPELDLATIVKCRSRADWLFADVADMVRKSAS
jgi:hypothetical protein